MGLFNRHQVPAAVVFVDDYVRGTLPGICVISGQPCTSTMKRSTPIERFNNAWFLLIFVGPIGWIILALSYSSANRSSLAGAIPVTRDEFAAARSASNQGRAFVAGGLLAGILALVANAYLDLPNLLVAVLLLAAVGMILAGGIRYARAEARWPEVRLDASRRWVTLVGVHPKFAAACDARNDEQAFEPYPL